MPPCSSVSVPIERGRLRPNGHSALLLAPPGGDPGSAVISGHSQPSDRRGPTVRDRVPLHRNPWLWAFLLGCVTLTALRPLLRHEPPPPPVIGQLPEFSLVDSRGQRFGSADLAGDVYVANFVFTRCASICPLLTRAMVSLEERYEREGIEGIRLVSISVDPEFDTPERLADYASGHRVDPRRWVFLTGEPADVRSLVVDGFRTAMGSPDILEGGMIDVAHTGKFVIVDGSGGIRGYYDTDREGLDEIFHRSRHVRDERGP